MIDQQVCEALGPDGTLINVARGSVVDEPALPKALQSGKLGSAGLDVFWNEPNPGPALIQLPNVTHHISDRPKMSYRTCKRHCYNMLE